MILDEKVKIKWNSSNKKYYMDMGYTFTKVYDELDVLISDLPKASEVRINVQCDECSKTWDTQYCTYIKNNHDGKYYCRSCANKNLHRDRKEERIKNGKILSFYDWCKLYPMRQQYLDAWDYELNDVSPKNISHSTTKKLYFKCCKRRIHKSELRSLATIIGSSDDTEMLCRQCSSFAQYLLDTHGDDAIEIYWSENNIISPWDVFANSEKPILLNCTNTDYHIEYKARPYDFTQGLGCVYCSGHQTHYEDSFGFYWENREPGFLDKYWDYEKNNEINIDPYKIRPQTNKNVWIKCATVSYHESYDTLPALLPNVL